MLFYYEVECSTAIESTRCGNELIQEVRVVCQDGPGRAIVRSVCERFGMGDSDRGVEVVRIHDENGFVKGAYEGRIEGGI